MIIPLIKAHLLFMESEHKRDAKSHRNAFKNSNEYPREMDFSVCPTLLGHSAAERLLNGCLCRCPQGFHHKCLMVPYNFILQSLCKIHS